MSDTDLLARINAKAAEIEAADTSGRLDKDRRAALAAAIDAAAKEADRDVYPVAHVSKDPALRDAAARLYRHLAMKNSWLEGRDHFSRAWIDQAVELAATDVLRDMLVSEQNRLRDMDAFAGIRAMCQQGLVDKARYELKRRRRLAKDPVLRKRLDELLADPRNLLGPVGTSPAMVTFNGFGTMLWGDRDRRPDGTHVSTLCIVFCFLPILPLRSYLVRRNGGYAQFFGRVPLSPFAFWWRRLAILGPLLFGLSIWLVESWKTNPWLVEGRAISTAEEKLAAKDYVSAVFALAKLPKSDSSSRLEKQDRIIHDAVVGALTGIQSPTDARGFVPGITGPVQRLGRPLGNDILDAAEAAVRRIAPQAGSGVPARDMFEWMMSTWPAAASRRHELGAQIAATTEDPHFLAAVVAGYKPGGPPCPPDLLQRFGKQLAKASYDLWDADAMVYLLAVTDPVEARPVLLKRIQPLWTGAAPAGELTTLKILPNRLLQLMALDQNPNIDQRVDGLEKLAAVKDLVEPEATWHRLGIARRLLKLFDSLHDGDPVKYPVSRIRPWAIAAAELDPGNPEARNQALRFLLEDGEFARVIALGTPSVQDPKVALLVGIAHARSGDGEKAAALLRPLVDRNLTTFTSSVQLWEKAVQSKTNAAYESLRKGTADQGLIGRLNAMPKEQARAAAEKWVDQQVQNDAYVARAAKTWQALDGTRAAAAELAMIDLGAGMSMPPGPERMKRLQSAEHLFLELRKVGADNPKQELHLGQVYFWLGKEKEAVELYAGLEKKADVPILHAMGEVYRGLSRMSDARRVLELAYGQGTDQQKQALALTRSLAASSQEDRMAWLKKADPNDTRIKMEIEQYNAEEAMRLGNYATATDGLKKVAAYYEGLPETSTSLNNAALIHDNLAIVTGDLKHLMEAARQLRKAHELSPEDGIVLNNYITDLQSVGFAGLAGSTLKPELLHQLPTWKWAEYAVPLPSPDDLAARVRGQADLRRCAELGVRSAVIAPDSSTGIEAQYVYHWLIRDADAMRKLRETIEAREKTREKQADAPSSDKPAKGDDKAAKFFEDQLRRSSATVDLCRRMGHGPSLAFALTQRASERYGGLQIAGSKQSLDLVMKDLDDAVAALDAYPVRFVKASILMAEAAKAVAASEPAFAAWVKDDEGLGSMVLPLYVRKNPARAESIQRNPAVQKAVEEVVRTQKAGNGRPWVRGWAWLEMAAHPFRDDARKLVRHPAALEARLLDAARNHDSVVDLVDAWLAATAVENQVQADRLAAQANEHGLLPGFFKP